MNIDIKNDTVTMTGDDYNRLVNAWEENDSMINEMIILKAKVNRLERENEALRRVQPMTELQLTKDSSVQGVPLTNEAYEKAIKEGE
ncbi:hypothetical protein QI034_07615 [Staphylococcus saprophyticus]|uniref:hypothetical protein n=1 Tax=Staphylococcus sp. 231237_7MaSpsaltlick TaxID=3367518 RepID=UPI002979C19A|nr:hypothetical protein [Staphylococcus saprophyticus]MDW4489096.1 hypothetical protein [Staphylococcus saprophyticus]MDW4523727.1 hypothetical protein [Staphylococcus saprophyticus]